MIEHLQLWRFESREAQREAWDEAHEHNEDLRQESLLSDEREASGYFDNEGEQREDAPV